MPLSEEELRLLEQMERALVEEDPKLASTLRGTTLRRSARRRAVLAGVGFAAGIAVLMVGVVLSGDDRRFWAVGVLGFVIMLGCATVALTALRGQNAPPPADPRAGHPAHGFTVIDGGRSGRGRGRRQRRGSHGTFMERMEARWRRRRDEAGGF
ncbi:MAG: DUF3040 domain-containing protein [Nocardioides sp.]